MSETTELDDLRAVVEAVREWVRRNEHAAEAEDNGAVGRDGMIDVGGGERRNPEDWVVEGWELMDAALKAAPKHETSARMARVCCRAMDLEKAWRACCDAKWDEHDAAFDAAAQRLYDAVREMSE